MSKFLLFSVLLLSMACGKTSTQSPAPSANLQGFQETSFENGVSLAQKIGNDEMTLEEGTLLNGKKNGTWTTYHPDNGRVATITSYINGKKNGVYLEFTNRGQIELRANYKDDIFNGSYASYKFGTRPVKEINYKMGKIDGFYKEYHNNGKLQKEVSYKEGIQDGPFRQYNDEEKLIMEYEYKNGEKVSGGVVTN